MSALIIILIKHVHKSVLIGIKNVARGYLDNMSLVASWLFASDYILPREGWSLRRVLRMPMVAGWINKQYGIKQLAFDGARDRVLTSASLWLINKLPHQVIKIIPVRYLNLPEFGMKISNWFFRRLPLPLPVPN